LRAQVSVTAATGRQVRTKLILALTLAGSLVVTACGTNTPGPTPSSGLPLPTQVAPSEYQVQLYAFLGVLHTVRRVGSGTSGSGTRARPRTAIIMVPTWPSRCGPPPR